MKHPVVESFCLSSAAAAAAAAGKGRWRFKIPVLVSDLDVQCALWLKLRLAPMCPWVGTISLAFVGPPAVKVQLSPYNRVRLMRIPVLQVRRIRIC
jgi:Ca2+-dependent lipid-binding protein